ncbi:hypothetical protein [[Clostridium] polysaccharolyticum]|uniref:ABC-2 family transporter protein n=1 Tax=[Clostridium] polysaccharolyticum TaxID=29364 RepID=A0A1I0BBJ1_9FIRM|nr:hypothetical protein [[Clostridium] polysaccharolyticum]SET04134.1 hypothetical protein SAMN04487772_10755 [[Clostridium] polysaccharolyticum]
MKTIHSLKIDLNKTIWNLGFFLSVLLTIALQFTNQIYVDGESGKTYCVLEALMKLSRSQIESDVNLSSLMVLQAGVAGYFIMFIPIIAAFPFIPNFCAERNSGLIRFTIQRTGKFRYYCVKFLSAVLGGGLSVLLGYIVFAVLMLILFPDIRTYNLSKEELSVLTDFYITKRLFLIASGIFLYGSVSAIPAFLMSSFVKNRYIITCVPFMITYLYSTGLTKLIYEGMEKGKQTLVDLGNTLKPEQITTLYYGDSISRNAIYVNMAFVAVSFFIFVWIMNGRSDMGE